MNGLDRCWSATRYLCKDCGLNFTNTPTRGKPLALKAVAVLLYVSGLSMNRTAKVLGVSTPTIQVWLEQFAAAYAQKPEPEGLIWKAWIVLQANWWTGECSGRDKATCKRLIQRLTRWRTRLYCADDYAVYDVLLPVGSSTGRGRDARHPAGQRPPAALAGAVRVCWRLIVVSKAKRMVDVSIALFARTLAITGLPISYLC